MTEQTAENATLNVFVQALRAITGVANVPLAEGLIRDFDRALPLPSGTVSSLVASLVDLVADGTIDRPFVGATIGQQHAVLRAMLESDDAGVRQVVNRIAAFSAFACWSDAGREDVERDGAADMPWWGQIGYPGRSDGYLDVYRRGVPDGFRAHADDDQEEARWLTTT